MNMTRTTYPDPAGYVALWRKVKALPDHAYVPEADRFGLPAQAKLLKNNFTRALHSRINLRGKINMGGRRYSRDYEGALFQDRMDLRDKLQRRVRVYQFRTDIVRRRFGHLLDDRNEQ